MRKNRIAARAKENQLAGLRKGDKIPVPPKSAKREPIDTRESLAAKGGVAEVFEPGLLWTRLREVRERLQSAELLLESQNGRPMDEDDVIALDVLVKGAGTMIGDQIRYIVHAG